MCEDKSLPSEVIEAPNKMKIIEKPMTNPKDLYNTFNLAFLLSSSLTAIPVK